MNTKLTFTPLETAVHTVASGLYYSYMTPPDDKEVYYWEGEYPFFPSEPVNTYRKEEV